LPLGSPAIFVARGCSFNSLLERLPDRPRRLASVHAHFALTTGHARPALWPVGRPAIGSPDAKRERAPERCTPNRSSLTNLSLRVSILAVT
jgi:hypothetical protein